MNRVGFIAIVCIMAFALSGCADNGSSGGGTQNVATNNTPVQSPATSIPTPEPTPEAPAEANMTLTEKYYKSESNNGSFIQFNGDNTFMMGSDDAETVTVGTYTFDGAVLILTVTDDYYRNQYFGGRTDTELSVTSDFDEIGAAGSDVVFLRSSVTLSETYYSTENPGGRYIQFNNDNSFIYYFETGREHKGTYRIIGDSLTLVSGGLTTRKKHLVISSDFLALEDADGETFEKR